MKGMRVEQVAEPEKVKLGLRLSQSRPLYEAFKQLKEKHGDELTPAQRRAVDAEIRDFVLGGVALEVFLACVPRQSHSHPQLGEPCSVRSFRAVWLL